MSGGKSGGAYDTFYLAGASLKWAALCGDCVLLELMPVRPAGAVAIPSGVATPGGGQIRSLGIPVH